MKTPEKLFEIYLKSVGRGANLILNVPPDGRGLFTKYDSAALMDFKKLRNESFSNDLAKNAETFISTGTQRRKTTKLGDNNEHTFETINTGQSVEVALKMPQKINCIVLKENLEKGQNCAEFTLHIMDANHKIIKEITGTTIGNKRILTFPVSEAKYILFSIEQQKAPTRISGLKIFRINDSLVEE